ncbi:MAG: hypothetical protein M3Y19_08150 [Actinomycetota bacterium]|nr:hypothetical protein [Actinomycetota bacterium]
MGVYRVLWLGAVGAFAVTGIVVAAVSMSAPALISLSLCAVIVGPLLAAGVHAQAHPDSSTPFVYVLGFTTSTALGAVAVSGLIAALGALALLGVLLLGVISPSVLRRLVHRKPRPADFVPAPPGPSAPSNRLASQLPTPAPRYLSLSDAELCWRWRTSFNALLHTTSVAERLRLIETRSALLDELARRDPEGFGRWISSGARAASDPARFLTPHREVHPPQHPDR